MKNFYYSLLILLGFMACKPSKAPIQAPESYDFCIQSAQIIDGTGAEAFEGDVLIRGDSIVYIGKVDTALVLDAVFIQANGRVLSPGFIDAHAHGDPFRNPDFPNFIAQGVSTICLGQDGFSPPTQNWNALLDSLDKVALVPNIAYWVGHGTLRQQSGVGFQKKPQTAEFEKMKALLTRAMEAGCFGMSTGLEYDPAVHASLEELLELAQIVGKYDGLIMSHMRNEDDDALEASIRELIHQGAYCKVHIAHLKSVYGKGSKRAAEILALLDSARAENIQLSADLYPYTASYTTIGIIFPDWARPPNSYIQARKNRGDELAEYLRNRVMKRNGPEATLFGTAPYAGKTLADLSQEMGKPFEQILMEDIGPRGASAAYFVMDQELQESLAQWPHLMIASDGSPTMRHPRGYGSIARLIEDFCLNKKQFSLPEAIRKISSLPAQTIGLTDRGQIKVGMKADLCLFYPDSIREKAHFEHPHQLATGMDYVWINGKLVWTQKGPTQDKPGRALRH